MTRFTQLLTIALFLSMITWSLSYIWFSNLGYFNDKRFTELLIICSSLLWNISAKAPSLALCNRGLINHHIYLSILIVLTLLSAIFSASPRHAILEICLLTGLFYLTLFTADLWKQQSFLFIKVLAYVILIGGVIYEIGFFSGYLASFIENIPLRWPEPFHGFTNLRFFNQYQLWTLALMSLPLLAFTIENTRFRMVLFAIIAGWWMMLFASAGRGVLLALCVSAMATFAVYRSFAFPFLRLQGFALLAGLSVHTLLFRIIPLFLLDPLYSGSALTGSVLRFTTEDRLTLWRQALIMAREHPFFGVGPMHFAWFPNAIAAHPHNSVLQLAAEWGLPATLLVLSLCAYGVYRWLKVFNITTLQKLPETERHLPIILFFTVTTCALYSLVDGVIVMPMSQIMMAVVVGLMLGVYSEMKPQQPVEIKIASFVPYRIFAGIVLVTLIWSVWPGLYPRLTGDRQKIPINLEVEGPRFWHEGGISK